MPPQVRINGTKAPILQPYQIDYDPTRGITVREEFHSAGDNLAGLANWYIDRNVAFTWKRGLVKSTIQATISGAQGGMPDAAAENWQLLANEIQKTIFEAPFALDGEASFPGILAKVKKAFQLLEDGDLDGELAIEEDLTDDEFNLVFEPLLTLLLRGSDHFPVGQPVLRHTFTVSNFYTGPLPDIGIAEVLMTTDDIEIENPLISRLVAEQISPGTSHAGYAWAWRRLPANAITTANNRVEISREWWWGEWSTRIYPLA